MRKLEPLLSESTTYVQAPKSKATAMQLYTNLDFRDFWHDCVEVEVDEVEITIVRIQRWIWCNRDAISGDTLGNLSIVYDYLKQAFESEPSRTDWIAVSYDVLKLLKQDEGLQRTWYTCTFTAKGLRNYAIKYDVVGAINPAVMWAIVESGLRTAWASGTFIPNESDMPMPEHKLSQFTRRLLADTKFVEYWERVWPTVDTFTSVLATPTFASFYESAMRISLPAVHTELMKVFEATHGESLTARDRVLVKHLIASQSFRNFFTIVGPNLQELKRYTSEGGFGIPAQVNWLTVWTEVSREMKTRSADAVILGTKIHSVILDEYTSEDTLLKGMQRTEANSVNYSKVKKRPTNNKESTTMNKNDIEQNTLLDTVHYVNGDNLADLTDAQVMGRIAAAEAEVRALELIEVPSKTCGKAISCLTKQITKLSKLLDKRNGLTTDAQ